MVAITLIGAIMILLGLVSFLTGYFFVGKSNGQVECSPVPGNQQANNIGGLVGSVLGAFLVLVGIILIKLA
jgi:hypothetical protein